MTYVTYPRNSYSRPVRPQRAANPMNWESFKATHPDEAAWIVAKRDTFDFAASMYAAILRFGDLTGDEATGQRGAVRRCMARDAQRAANPVQTVTVEASMQPLRDALEARRGKVMIAGFQFSKAPAGGRNPGAIYVKKDGAYIGKIVGDTFTPGRDFDPSDTARLQDACRDPAGAVRRFAEETARRLAEAALAGLPMTLPCGCCGITLTDPVSIARGIGPICAGKWGF